MTNSAYVYSYTISGIVRYIGKGRGLRSRKHLSHAKQLIAKRRAGLSVRATRFYNGLAAALEGGTPIEITVLAEGLSDEEAYALEQAEIGRLRPQLWNAREGGSGMTTEDALSRWSDPEYRALQKEVGQPARLRALWSDPDFVERSRERSRERLKALWADPSKREALTSGTRNRWLDPEFRARKTAQNRELARATNARPEIKAAKAEIMRRVNADPELTAKRKAAAQAYWARRREMKRQGNPTGQQ